MAKRKRNINIEKMIREGRGQGRGPEYKPWIRIQDVPSLGRATRLKGIKTKRQHEFLYWRSFYKAKYFIQTQRREKCNKTWYGSGS